MAGKVFIVGYGNLDRQDDGVAWHVLAELTIKLGQPTPQSPEDLFTTTSEDLVLLYALQLTPELAEEVAKAERVCFVDAHTGSVSNNVNVVSIEAQYQTSPFTHHTTPETCLALAETLYGRKPEAILVSVRGYEFGFSRVLSLQTGDLVEEAVSAIYRWINNDKDG